MSKQIVLVSVAIHSFLFCSPLLLFFLRPENNPEKVSQFNGNKFGFHTGRHQFGEREDFRRHNKSLAADESGIQGQRQLHVRTCLAYDRVAYALVHGPARHSYSPGRRGLMRIYQDKRRNSGLKYFINN
jgi:hypothetical protein